MTTAEMGRVHVFIMEPTGSAGSYAFPWNWNKWKLETRLIPQSSTKRARGMGDASFQMLRRRRYEPEQRRNFHLEYADGVIAGAWICIATGDLADIHAAETGLDPDAVQWWGWIARIDKTPVLIQSSGDAMGTVSALEVGHLLDSVQVSGWLREGGDGNYPTPMGAPPTANIATKGGIVIGNAVSTTNLDGGGNVGYAFALLAETCSSAAANIFTRWRLLRHLLLACKPAAFPDLLVACADGSESDDPNFDPTWDPDFPRIAGYLNDTTGPEIYDLRELTLQGALDLTIPETHDLDYRFDLDRTSWTIYIATVSTDDTHGLPVAVPVDVTLDSTCADFQPTESGADIPDEVVFEGAAIRFGVSASPLDENWGSKYSDAQQTAYEDATPTERRTGPEHEDTFTLFGVVPNASGDLRRSEEPGTGGDDFPMCPEVGWSGAQDDASAWAVKLGARWNAVSAGWSASSSSFPPYLPTATLLNVVPWPLGLKSDGTDTRTDDNKAHPSYLKPKVFNYDASLDAADQWFELTAKKNPETDASNLVDEAPQVQADDGSPSLRIAFNVPHRLGLGTFAEDADDDNVSPDIDWRNFVVTFGIESDQRLRIVKRRQVAKDGGGTEDLPAQRVRRSLVVRDDRFQFWAVLKGTVLGVTDTAGTVSADRLTVTNEPGLQGYITRNDYPAAERYVRRLATWAFRSRTPVTITVIRPDAPPTWAKLCTVIGDVIDTRDDLGTESTEANTIIREIRQTWGTSPRLAVSSEILAQPKPVSPSAAGGGAVSVTGGGTLAQGVARLGKEVGRLQEGTQRRMIYPGSSPAISAAVVRVAKILGGNPLSATVDCIQYATSVTPAAVYDPDVDTVYPTGLGNAWLWIDDVMQANRVLVRHAFSADQQPLIAGRTVRVVDTETLTYLGTDMTAYLVSWL